MKITSAKVIVCSPGRNFVTLKIETEGGVHGLGDATLNGRELAVASYLTDHVIPLLIGRDAVSTTSAGGGEPGATPVRYAPPPMILVPPEQLAVAAAVPV